MYLKCRFAIIVHGPLEINSSANWDVNPCTRLLSTNLSQGQMLNLAMLLKVKLNVFFLGSESNPAYRDLQTAPTPNKTKTRLKVCS